MDLYIYYRVHANNVDALRGRALSMQGSIARECGIVCELKRRPEEKDGRQTWMEVYHSVPAGFEATLGSALAQAGLAALIDGPRHTEIFVDVSSCA